MPAPMMDNHVYNVMNQLAQEHKSLWRIRDQYKKDAGDCEECKGLWERMEKDKMDHVEELGRILKSHM